MAKYCTICNDKLPLFGEGPYLLNKYPICDSCNKRYRESKDDNEYELACRVISPDRVKQRILEFNATIDKCSNSEVKNYLNEIVKGRLESILAFEQRGDDFIEKYFPADKTMIVGDRLWVNQEEHLFAFARMDENGHVIYKEIHQWSDLIDFDVCENGSSVIQGRAVEATVGAILGGLTGAIIGSAMSKEQVKTVNDLHIILSFSTIKKPEIVKLIEFETPTNSAYYQTVINNCNEIVSTLKTIISDNGTETKMNKKEKAVIEISVPDEIMKYKNLLDIGAITEEEYKAQKQKLLNLSYE